MVVNYLLLDLLELRKLATRVLNNVEDSGRVEDSTLLELERVLAVPSSHWTNKYNNKEDT